MAFLIGGANSAADTGYNIDNSLRFEDGDSPFLSFTPAGAGNRRTWTFSAWVKLGTLGINRVVFAGGVGASTYLRIFDSDKVGFGVSGDADYEVGPFLRDPSAWYHIVWKVDTTAGSNRMIIFLNGESIYSGTPTSWGLNHDGHINQDELHSVGKETDGTSADRFFDGYMAEVFFIDGTAHDASDFGETDSDSGIWKPKDCKDDLTFGTNGFYLEFKQTGTSADASGKGADTSGEDNHYDDNGMTATDQSTDTPTNNFCTLNPLINSSQASYSEGNLDEACNDNFGVAGSIAVANGKWYWEVKILAGDNNLVGVANADEIWRVTEQHGINNYSITVYGVNGKIYKEGVVVEDVADTYGADDIIGIRLDLDSGTRTVAFYKNDSAFGSAVELPSWGIAIPMIRKGGSSQTTSFNFGSPSFAISSGNADANDYGNFEYAVPSSHYALCTKNLAEYG